VVGLRARKIFEISFAHQANGFSTGKNGNVNTGAARAAKCRA
jgi:hypothetical protein